MMWIKRTWNTPRVRRGLTIVLGAALLAMPAGARMPLSTRALAQTDGATLTVKMTGFCNEKGGVGVALYRDQEGYDKEKAFREAKAEIKGGVATVVFRHLAPGPYAVASHHDENRNGKIDYSLLRRSIEGIGVSNNVRLTLTHEPTWAEARFTIDGAEKAIELKMQYSF